MRTEISGKRVVFVVAKEGIEQAELTQSLKLDDFDAMVIPGGVANAGQLRTDWAAVRFVREFFESGKPTDLKNAGASRPTWPWPCATTARTRS